MMQQCPNPSFRKLFIKPKQFCFVNITSSDALMVSATLAGRIVVDFFNKLFLVLRNN